MKTWEKDYAMSTTIFRYLGSVLDTIEKNDPAVHSRAEGLLYPFFQASLFYFFARRLYLKGHFFLARALSEKAKRKTGIEIHPGARIGEGFFIDHGTGVVIGETAVIGRNVVMYHGATLGGTGKASDKGEKRHPTVGDNVLIGTGATVLGDIFVADGTKVGAGAVLLSSTKENQTVVGVPARPVERKVQKAS